MTEKDEEIYRALNWLAIDAVGALLNPDYENRYQYAAATGAVKDMYVRLMR